MLRYSGSQSKTSLASCSHISAEICETACSTDVGRFVESRLSTLSRCSFQKNSGAKERAYVTAAECPKALTSATGKASVNVARQNEPTSSRDLTAFCNLRQSWILA